MKDLAAFSVLGLFLAACGGATPTPEGPDGLDPPADPPADMAPSATAAAPNDEAPKEEPKPADAAPAADPQFQDGMSVEEAIKAVPQGAERANIDAETLGKPLQDFAVYEPCKPGTTRFKLRVAVWDGKVVGADVSTTPKNEKLTACIKDRLKGLTWQAKVRSLNVVEYAF